MNPITTNFLKFSQSSTLGLRDQVCEAIYSTISSQLLPKDRPLPSCRELSRQLGVSRNTIFSAYKKMVDLGLITSIVRSGYYVNINFDDTHRKIIRNNFEDAIVSPLVFSNTESFQEVKDVNWKSYDYPFYNDVLNIDQFPLHAWRECTRQALGRKHLSEWADAPDDYESRQLIKQVSRQLFNTRGICADEEEIILTQGSADTIFTLGTIFAANRKPIAIENPGHIGVRNAFKLSGNEVVPVPVNTKGIAFETIPKECQSVFTTPSHQHPTTVNMNLELRVKFIDFATKNNLAIIEDETNVELIKDAKMLPPLYSLDKSARVIYIGGLSRIASMGCMVGFLVAHRDIVRRVRDVRRMMVYRPPLLVQEVMSHFIRLGYYESYINKLQKDFQKRWQTVGALLDMKLNNIQFKPSKGGTAFWLSGPDGFDSMELTARLNNRGMLINSGHHYYLNGEDTRNFRIEIGCVPHAKIEQGIDILSQEIQNML